VHRGLALSATILLLVSLACSNEVTPPGPGPYPSCLSQEEIDLVTIIQQARADSGRPPLVVDTRLIQAARLNTSRMRDATATDSVEFGGTYGISGEYVDFGFGFSSASDLYSEWLSSMTSARQVGFGILLGPTGRLFGVSRDMTVATTPSPRWSIVVSTSTATPVTNGSCTP
jgi:hypothetical protein